VSEEELHETLRKLAIRDEAYVCSLLSRDSENVAASRLDPRAHALVRLGALIAIDATLPSYISAVEAAAAHGASREEIVGTLIAVLPSVGSERVVSAAPKIGLALGYDVEAALEGLGLPEPR
jgi:alkylhydroperoxidase/carboxymuconolactone decarboxylase family protein YurZ